MTRQQLFAAFFFAVFLFLLFQFYRILEIFLVPLTWAALLALMFHPLQTRLTRLLRGRPGAAAFLLTTMVIVVVMVPTVLLIMLLANESVVFYQSLSAALEGGQPQRALERLRAWTPERAREVLAALQTWNVDAASVAAKAANAVSRFLAVQAAGIARNVVAFMVNFFLVTFALFFFFRDGSRMAEAVRDILPMESRHKDVVLERLYDTVSAVMQGTLATAAAQGLLAGLAFWVLGVPFALLLGCLSAFFSLLPLGTPVVWGTVALYLGLSGSLTRAILLVLWGTLVVGTVDNILRPLLIGGRTEIPTVLLFFGILGGLQAYGFLGVFLAPTVIAILVAFARIYREEYGTAG